MTDKPKIIIIGGGIGGLSCAMSLIETGKFDVSIYESDIIGGQSSSQKSELCNTEISWRLIGESYTNFLKILTDLDVLKNLYSFEKNDACLGYDLLSPYHNTIGSVIQNCNYTQINKLLTILFLSKDRALNDYHDINTYNYYNSWLTNLIIGPYFGSEPTKATLSSFYKYLFSIFIVKKGNKSYFTKYPTNDAIFEPWKKYLIEKGAKIYEHTALQSITTNKEGTISGLNINNKIYTSDEIVFACSLQSLNKLFEYNEILKNKPIYNKLTTLITGQQFYISVNFYWKRPIIKDRKCHIYTFTDGWMPIIIKRFINTDYVENNCNKNIKEVWNIGLADYLNGNYIKKYTSQCSFGELVYELKMNILNSKHFKDYFDFENYGWDDYFYDYEFDNRYYEKLPTTEKFSVNNNIEENLLDNNEPELGNNIYFSAYYVKNTFGSASMESSCEIGLKTADLICKKYKVETKRKPTYKTQKYITILTIPFVILDYILYKLNIAPITDIIHPFILLISYFILILIVLIKFLNYNQFLTTAIKWIKKSVKKYNRKK